MHIRWKVYQNGTAILNKNKGTQVYKSDTATT